MFYFVIIDQSEFSQAQSCSSGTDKSSINQAPIQWNDLDEKTKLNLMLKHFKHLDASACMPIIYTEEVQKYLKVKQLISENEPLIIHHAMMNNIDEVKKCLDKGISVDFINKDGVTALHEGSRRFVNMTYCFIDIKIFIIFKQLLLISEVT